MQKTHGLQLSGPVFMYSENEGAALSGNLHEVRVIMRYTYIHWKVERGAIKYELSQNVMGNATEKLAIGNACCHSIEQLWQDSVSSVSCGPAPCQQVHHVLSRGWVVWSLPAQAAVGINSPIMG